jgi:hypothetical protein
MVLAPLLQFRHHLLYQPVSKIGPHAEIDRYV